MAIPFIKFRGDNNPSHYPIAPVETFIVRFPTLNEMTAGAVQSLRERLSKESAEAPAAARTAAVSAPLIGPFTEKERLNREKSLLAELLRYAADQESDPGIVLGAFILLSQPTKTCILEALWKDHGYVDLLEYANTEVRKDPFVLARQSGPFLHSSGGTLVEQMIKLIDQKIQEEETRSIISILHELERACKISSKSNAQLLEIFNRLPIEQQNYLSGQVYHHSPERIAIERWGERKLRTNVRCLIALRDRSRAGAHLLDQSSRSLLESVNEKKAAEQKAHFLALYDSNKIGHFELKRLFEALPPSVQSHRDIPKPPFYGRGIRPELYNFYGPHNLGEETTFRVYAPKAKEVRLAIRPSSHFPRETFIGMRQATGGAWEATTPAPPGTIYQYLVTGQDNIVRRKADPYARESIYSCFDSEATHGNSRQQLSVVADTSFIWTDEESIASRNSDADAPATIYEMHASSWKKNTDGSIMNWRDLAIDLARYLKTMGYTHVELIGLMEHPDEKSWGYQPTSFFAINSRMGSVKDFKFFVNHLHSNGIRVIADWVPGHFAIDEFGLRNFDGSSLYEHHDSRRSHHAAWDVYKFDYEKRIVRDFIISSANYLIKELHIDGIRVDAATSMLYVNEGRKKLETELEILPHHKGKKGYGGELHSDTKTLFRDLNVHIDRNYPGVITHVEESSGFPDLTVSVLHKSFDDHRKFSTRGLGFKGMWRLSVPALILRAYMRKNPTNRDHLDICKAMNSSLHERVVDPTSHDETATGHGSLRGKMCGSLEEQFAQVRLWISRAMCFPGMKLQMMGNEIAQMEEWSGRLIDAIEGRRPGISSFEWDAIQGPGSYGPCLQVQQMVKELNHLYLSHPALHSSNLASDFLWIDGSDTKNNVISYHRTSKDTRRRVACVHNFGSSGFEEYEINLPNPSYDPLASRIRGIREIFNSDDRRFGGKGMTNIETHASVIFNEEGISIKLKVKLAPYSTMIFEEILG